jgi:hypothetical protein
MNMATLVMTKVRTGWPTVCVAAASIEDAVFVDGAAFVDAAVLVDDAVLTGALITSDMMSPPIK